MGRLQRHLEAVADDGQGRLLSIRGRRQAGKSRLVTEFADRTGLPQLFFTGARLAEPRSELARFALEATGSSLPGASLFDGVVLDGWAGALRLLAAALPDGPSVIVFDEFPWLHGTSPDLEGALQVAWDRIFERRPVLFILIGSDISVMEALGTYERPLFGRVKELVVNPFELGDTAQMIAVDDPAVAIDAQLVTGGYPRICAEWRGATDALTFLEQQLSDEHSELIDVGRNVLEAEFPPAFQATRVLMAIGWGERTFKGIRERSGIGEQQLSRALEALTEAKRAVSGDRPMSLKSGNDPRYRVADPYLRFWLRFIEPSQQDIARGRPDLALARVRASWKEFRGRAVEPIIRASVEKLVAGDADLSATGAVGGYWTRSMTVEVDLVGVDRWPSAGKVTLTGSVKWRDQAPFDRRDLENLIKQRSSVPGAADAALVGVSRTGFATEGLDRTYGPADLVQAWGDVGRSVGHWAGTAVTGATPSVTLERLSLVPDSNPDFSAFYKESFPRVITFLLMQGSSSSDATDIAQEAFMDAYQKWPINRHPDLWVRKSASAKYSRLVDRNRKVVGDPTDTLEEISDARDSLGEVEQIRDLIGLLGQLPSSQRQIMAFRLDGFTQSEVAETLGISEGAVAASLHDARAALEKLVAKRVRARDTDDHPRPAIRHQTNTEA